MTTTPEETAEERDTRRACQICHAFSAHLSAMVQLNKVYELTPQAYVNASLPIHLAQEAHEADAHPTFAARIKAARQPGAES